MFGIIAVLLMIGGFFAFFISGTVFGQIMAILVMGFGFLSLTVVNAADKLMDYLKKKEKERIGQDVQMAAMSHNLGKVGAFLDRYYPPEQQQ